METSIPSKEALVGEEPSEADEEPVKSDPDQNQALSRVLREEFDSRYNIVDLQTPLNAFMSGQYKKSFAYYTLRSRLPVILTNVIDTLTRDKSELVAQFGESSCSWLRLQPLI